MYIPYMLHLTRAVQDGIASHIANDHMKCKYIVVTLFGYGTSVLLRKFVHTQRRKISLQQAPTWSLYFAFLFCTERSLPTDMLESNSRNSTPWGKKTQAKESRGLDTEW